MLVRALLALPTGLLWLFAGASHASEPLWLNVIEPRQDAVVSEMLPWLQVRGRAVAGTHRPFDMIVAVDLSASTLYPSGVDVDGDGVTGQLRRGMRRGHTTAFRRSHKRWTTDAGDTVVRAELLAAQRLLRRLEDESIRAGLITFAGRARTRSPLGEAGWALEELLRVRVKLDQTGTNLAAAIRAATRAFERSPAPEPRDRILVLLSDGYPTVPAPEIHARSAALKAARRAAERGVRIFSFALGQDAVERPDVLRQVAAVTEGQFTEVRNAGDVIRTLPRMTLAQLDDADMVNLTTGKRGRAVRVFADGSFDGLVPVVEGENLVRVTAVAGDGSRLTVDRRLRYEVPEKVTVGHLLRANDLKESLRGRTAEMQVQRALARGPEYDRRIEVELEGGASVAPDVAERAPADDDAVPAAPAR